MIHQLDLTTPCEVWLKALDRDGYGVSMRRGAHRVVFEQRVGPIPAGLELDHLCRNRSCVNPQHLEPVTHLENVRRANALRTHCKSGHEYNEVNTLFADGKRKCRICRKRRDAEYLARRAERNKAS